MKKRVLSGMRPTGRLHLGNYLGAAKGMLELQDNPEYETLYTVVDVHALTTPYDVEELREAKREVMLDYLAVGLDPEKSIIFMQSHVPEHLELQFYFSSVMTIARMQHLPTFKEKVKQHPEHATMALLNYPILMAADILIYKAELVPVGIDQEPHLEVAREVARKMNEQYGMDFPEPERFATAGEYVPSLTGEGKMSKSVPGSYISLTDDLETIRERVAKVPSDSGKGEIQNPKSKIQNREYVSQAGDTSHGVKSLMQLVELFEGEEQRKEYEEQYENDGIRYGDLKSQLSEAIFAELKPIQERRRELEAKPEYVDEVMAEGAKKAREMARETVGEVKEKMGLV